ncbi:MULTISPECIES: tetratricopeptide repeat protein [unclassified Polaribacter]|uniref:tetratricopeptide repeat protein n=1 Tax=unclassified Polaribacter TaxID=196858 RepID=UPI0011BD9232|nr:MULTISPECIES: tetratricopeptide repeat protein [unclassified Polaribacter]TXD51139.1 tetratricopeptide repeat protein [Polaribacter sp. IC063]TXD56768.1 tetratricopeptide repeat protein [Polaribacter sp. IC066]
MNLKNKIAVLFLAMGCTITITAQKVTVATYHKMELAKYQKVIKQSLTYGDASTAVQAMHSILALKEENSSYKDSLVSLYFGSGKYNSSLLLSKELLLKKPKNKGLLEIQALSYQNLGNPLEAIKSYENLVPISKNFYHAYQLGYLQFSVKRLLEASKTLDVAMTMEQTANIKKIELSFPSVQDQNKTQNVPLMAAFYNLKGLIYYDLKENEKAKTAFENALKIMPTFEYAQQSLNALDMMAKTKE